VHARRNQPRRLQQLSMRGECKKAPGQTCRGSQRTSQVTDETFKKYAQIGKDITSHGRDFQEIGTNRQGMCLQGIVPSESSCVRELSTNEPAPTYFDKYKELSCLKLNSQNGSRSPMPPEPASSQRKHCGRAMDSQSRKFFMPKVAHPAEWFPKIGGVLTDSRAKPFSGPDMSRW